MSLQLADCYAICRQIARREARNFYYSFLVLPARKRDAICAVYAFMRHADDLADDESVANLERRSRLEEWLTAWHAALNGSPTENPIFIALIDAQHRFGIPALLLDQLVQGTTMDLLQEPAEYSAALHTFADFAELYRYCYLVASVVGLVCIRIFGYRDATAEQLAEETGIAFQLTNIVRDVGEDASRQRIYLPLEDLRRFSVLPADLILIRTSSLSPNQRDLLAFEAQRARLYYASAEKLLPLVSEDSQPALWVLVSIYRRLLRRIEQQNYNVFSAKIRVPAHEKLWILSRGLSRLLRYRLLG